MIRNRSGKVIKISSSSAKKDCRNGGGAYSASKTGILGLRRVLELELGKYGINVNIICLGFVETEMTTKA